MADACLVFTLHHAERLRHVRVFDGSADFGNYIDEAATAQTLQQAARQSFIPALKLLLAAARRRRLKFGICPTGPLLRTAEKHVPELLEAMRDLQEAGAVEWIASPWDASILSIYPGEHLTYQLEIGAAAIERLLGARPTTAANTELIYDNHVARKAAAAGIRMVLCGYPDRDLRGRSSNQLFRAAGEAPVRILARQTGLSDDWGIRFSDRSWGCHPLQPQTYADWIATSLRNSGGTVCPIMLHLADLGLTHPASSGIFTFTRRLLMLLARRGINCLTPTEAAERGGGFSQLEVLDVPQATSGVGPDFDLSPWLGNAMQSNALHLLRKALKQPPLPARDDALLRLCAADHLHHMRYWQGAAEGGEAELLAADPPAELRRRPSPYDGPYDAYIDYTNALEHLLARHR